MVDCLRERDAGRFIREGEPIGTVVAGRWQIRTMLTEEQMADGHPVPGDRVEVRMAACPSSVCAGVVNRVASAGSRTMPVDSLTHLGGGGTDALRHGMAGRVRFRAGPDSIGAVAVRRLIRFAISLQQR